MGLPKNGICLGNIPGCLNLHYVAYYNSDLFCEETICLSVDIKTCMVY